MMGESECYVDLHRSFIPSASHPKKTRFYRAQQGHALPPLSP